MSAPIWVIIPAAGVGQRMQAACPKQYLPLSGQTILDRTIGLFIDHPHIAGVAVGISENDAYWPDSQWFSHPQVIRFNGGDERSDTVLNGLALLLQTKGIQDQAVLVHDAARPLLSSSGLQRILCHQGEQGALLAMPAKDTVKQQNSAQCVQTTLDRQYIWLAQTPQKFPANALHNALVKAKEQGLPVTDECSAMEMIGWQPALVEGESRNLKITLPEDLVMAEALLQQTQKASGNPPTTGEKIS
ncbi:2-C-methyl-D-erythritol 4-phosphate cytidylyltransferase [Marinomonas sp.]